MKTNLTHFVITLIFIPVLLRPSSSFAQAGSLDMTFNNAGAFSIFMGGESAIHSIVMQIDGKIVLAGYNNNMGGNSDFAIVRLNTDGSLDTTFDNDGRVTTTFGSANDFVNAVAIQSDGKIVVAGYTTNGTNADFALARYNSNGSLDTSFDGDGKVVTDFGSPNDFGTSIAIQSDGKIVVGGRTQSTNYDFAIARYNIDGSLDSSFALNGKIITNVLGDDGVNSIAIQNDGKIVAAGYNAIDFALARYNTNGSIDSSFDNDGIVTNGISILNSFAEGSSMAIQTDGKIIVAGTFINPMALALLSDDFAIVRYNINGSLDSSFDNDGKVITNFGNEDAEAYSVGLQSDGKIVVAGATNNSTAFSGGDFALARYNIDGSLDSTFDTDGKVTTNFTWNAVAYSVAIQSDGKIIAVGSTANFFPYEFAIARYNNCTSVTLSQSPTICAGQSITIGSNTYTVSGTYTDVFTSSVNGCDSTVITNLTILPANTFTQSLTICAGQSITVGSNTHNATGIYTDVLTSLVNGCDSNVITNLIVLMLNTSVQWQTICAGQSITIGSHTYNVSGTYTDTLIAANTCDSIVTTNVTVIPIPVLTTSVTGSVITSNQTTALYQWIDCNNGSLPIAGETNQSFTPTSNGSYAVIVTLGSCADTSACVNFISVGVSQLSSFAGQISIYPNPFSYSAILQSSNLLKNSTLNVYNLFGQQVKQIQIPSGQIFTFYRDNLPSGMYFMKLVQDEELIAAGKILITD